jgi:hypothetical protein
MKTIDQYKKVLSDTESKNPTLVEYWARRAVISEALMGSAYLKRRIKELLKDEKTKDKMEKINKSLSFLKELKPICNADNLGHMITGLFDKEKED